MTFIASVIAKKGVAIIADSLVTSQAHILHYPNFLAYLQGKPQNAQGEVVVNPDEIKALFGVEPLYTRDYEEKLFKLNKYTAITTTGIAYINKKSIADIIEEFKRLRGDDDIENMAIPIETKIEQLTDFLNIQVREHLNQVPIIGYCVLIVTFYNTVDHKTSVYRLIINETDNSNVGNANFNYVTLVPEIDWVKVVCDGQNKISDKVLYGFGKTFHTKFEEIVNNILGRLNLADGVVPNDFIEQLGEDPYYNNLFYSDVEMLNLSELSLQQAVNLASLLMRLEVDFQKYTKTKPTVGGVIKLAIIDEDGFEFIAGHIIEAPKHINV